jgi:serine/threonine-protein kinase
LGQPDTERYRAGDRIADKYVLVRALDSGGMGLVWAAHNVDLDVHVAIKLLRGELTATNAADRLLSEARMLARLQHPGIVRVHDCGKTPHGDPFIVMELLDGECLADFMERTGRISAIDAVSLLLPVADAIRVAHDAGIVHRDLKPENIFLANVGGRVQPKVLDFGIALAEFVGTRRTTHGAVLGSPAYMSPEQARGDDVGKPTDIWALSVVLFELVTGTLPFESDNYHATLRAIIELTPPSITQLSAGDELLAAIVERGMAKDPAVRYSSVRKLGMDLAQWLFSHGVAEDASNVSLRTTWLSSPSDPPSSLSPVTVGRPSFPSLSQRETLRSPAAGVTPHIRVDLEKPEVKRSTEGVAISTEFPKPRRPWLRIAIGAAASATIGFAAFWLWASKSKAPAADASAQHAVEPAPAPKPEPHKSTPVPPVTPDTRESGTDAGMPSEPVRSAPRPAAPSRGRPSPKSDDYRPRGI